MNSGKHPKVQAGMEGRKLKEKLKLISKATEKRGILNRHIFQCVQP